MFLNFEVLQKVSASASIDVLLLRTCFLMNTLYQGYVTPSKHGELYVMGKVIVS